VPYGVTFLAPAGRERLLTDLACAFVEASVGPDHLRRVAI
jgi:allophanate hydrolase